jgi:HD-like signal output (HDOD) protein
MRTEDIALDPQLAAQWKLLRDKGVVIPKQPQVLLQIQQLGESPGFQTRHLAALIRKDASLSARLLYIVNSPAYGLVDAIDNIEEAVLLLGIERTLNLCRSVLLREAFAPQSPALEIFWDRSAVIAELTAALAYRQHVVVSSDLAYMTGLFHACGVAVLAKAIPGYEEALADQKTWMHLLDHDRQFGVDHVSAGYLVCRFWRLPEMAAQVVRQQRGYVSCPDDCMLLERCHAEENMAVARCAGLVSSLQLALLIYCRMFLQGNDSEWESLRGAALDNLGMNEEVLANFA